MLTKTLEQNNLQHRTHCTEKKIEKRGKDKGFGYLKKDDDHVDDLDKYKEKKKKIIEGYIIEEARKSTIGSFCFESENLEFLILFIGCVSPTKNIEVPYTRDDREDGEDGNKSYDNISIESAWKAQIYEVYIQYRYDENHHNVLEEQKQSEEPCPFEEHSTYNSL